MIGELSTRLAAGIKKRAPDHPASEAVLRYTISFLLNTVPIIVLTLIISLLTGRFPGALTALVAFPLLRQVSGGLHLKSGVMCVLVSTGGATLISFSSFDQSWTFALTIAAVVLVAIYAPSRIEKQTRINPTYFPALRIISILLVASNFIFNNPVLAAVFMVQAATLIRVKSRGEVNA